MVKRGGAVRITATAAIHLEERCLQDARVLSWFVLAVIAACRLDPREQDTSQFCCTDLATCAESGGVDELRPCTDPMASFCDNHGQFTGSESVGRTCIAEPGGRTCDAPADCPDPRAPVCDLPATQTCTDCASAADCTGFADRPLCHPDRGSCVECVAAAECPTERPICDPDGLCRECTLNSHCTSELCNVTIGSCVPQAEVLYVGQGGVGMDCTRTEPCGSVQRAIDLVTPTRTGIRISSGDYDERVTIDGKSFYLFSDGGTLRAPAGEVGPIVTITGAGAVGIDSLRIRAGVGATGHGVDCNGTSATDVTLRGVLVEDNAGFGITSTGCRLAVLDARIDQNAGGGIKVTRGDVVVQNDFITRNGTATSSFGGLDLAEPTTLAADFNTIADNVAVPSAAAGIQCRSVLPRILSSNLVYGVAPLQLAGTNCTFEYTLSNEAVPGTGNLTTPPTFTDGPMGDYHLAPGSAGIDVADVHATLTTDVDGDLRPQGARYDIGADEVAP